MPNLKYTLATAAIALTALSACATTLPEPLPGNGPSCGAGRVQHFVGKKLNPRNDRAISDLSRAGNIRRIAPNSAVTMDYRTDRLNIYFNENNRITKINCG